MYTDEGLDEIIQNGMCILITLWRGLPADDVHGRGRILIQKKKGTRMDVCDHAEVWHSNGHKNEDNGEKNVLFAD